MIKTKSNKLVNRAAQCERQGFFDYFFSSWNKVIRRQVKRCEMSCKNQTHIMAKEKAKNFSDPSEYFSLYKPGYCKLLVI